MKPPMNRWICIFLLVAFTAFTVYQTEETAKYQALRNVLHHAAVSADALPQGEKERLTLRFNALLQTTGLLEDEAFTAKAEQLLTRFTGLLERIANGEQTLSETAFMQELDALFREIVKIDVQTQKEEAENALRGDDSFTALAISLFWDYLDFYEAHFHDAPSVESGVTVQKDIFYTDAASPLQAVDIYKPEDAEQPLPVILEIHGGGLMYGDKDKVQLYASKLAKRGYMVVTVNYRLAPQVQYDAQVRDILDCYRWLKRNGAQYGADLKNVYVVGDSAGGQLAYYTSLVLQSESLCRLYETEPFSFPIRALGLVSGMFDMKSGPNSVLLSCMLGYEYKSSPYFPYLQPEEVIRFGQLPPCFIVTEKKDFLRTASLNFADLLKAKGIPYVLLDKKWGMDGTMGHITSVAFPELPESRKTTDDMLSFFAEHRKNA